MLDTTAPARDNEGYILDPEIWNEDLADRLAGERGLQLTAEHWPVLHFMRDFWREHHIAPDVRHVTRHLVETQGYDKKTAKQRLFELFPYGYMQQACKIAGMRRPRAWSTG